ncbi:MAG: hypothetical protein XD68_0731 [Synergistales bacterium 54_24]|nr:MAG: hypothetical protein XD68_0731 [Synergistales bacterium 54_24]
MASPDLERRICRQKSQDLPCGSARDDDYARIALSYGAQALRYARIWKSFLAFLDKGSECSIVIGEQCAPFSLRELLTKVLYWFQLNHHLKPGNLPLFEAHHKCQVVSHLLRDQEVVLHEIVGILSHALGFPVVVEEIAHS